MNIDTAANTISIKHIKHFILILHSSICQKWSQNTFALKVKKFHIYFLPIDFTIKNINFLQFL